MSERLHHHEARKGLSMDCEWTEKVSSLLDAELTTDESLRVTAHIAQCPACQRAQQEFLRLRREVKAYDFQPQPFAQARMLARILHAENVPLWRRRISMPVPLMTLLLAIIVALGVWSATLRRRASEQSKDAPGKRTFAQALPSQAVAVEGGGMDFSHYDHGERAAIYKVRRTETISIAPAARR